MTEDLGPGVAPGAGRGAVTKRRVGGRGGRRDQVPTTRKFRVVQVTKHQAASRDELLGERRWGAKSNTYHQCSSSSPPSSSPPLPLPRPAPSCSLPPPPHPLLIFPSNPFAYHASKYVAAPIHVLKRCRHRTKRMVSKQRRGIRRCMRNNKAINGEVGERRAGWMKQRGMRRQ